MPKLLCRCGFTHNLSPIPDDGWRTIRDRDYDAYTEAVVADRASDGPLTAHQFIGLLYECPQCGRIMWSKQGTRDFAVFGPDRSETEVEPPMDADKRR